MISDDSLGLRLTPPEVQTLIPKPLKPSNKCLKAHIRLEGEVSTVIDFMIDNYIIILFLSEIVNFILNYSNFYSQFS